MLTGTEEASQPAATGKRESQGLVVPHGPACMAQGKPHVPTGLRWDWWGSGGGTLSSAPPGPRCKRRRPEEARGARGHPVPARDKDSRSRPPPGLVAPGHRR